MALFKRFAFWLLAFCCLAIVAATILIFSIDRRIKIYPGMVRELSQCKTLAEVEAFLGEPPGDYTTAPYSFDPPDAAEPPLQKEQRNQWLASFGREGKTRKMWITNDGCILISVNKSGKIVAYGQTKVYLSRQPNLLERLKGRLGIRHAEELQLPDTTPDDDR